MAPSRAIGLALLSVLLLASPALASPPPAGGLSQLSGTSGCVSALGTACAAGRGLAGPESVVVSPDGLNVYVGSEASGAGSEPGLAVFARNPASSALSQLPGKAGCLTRDGSSSAGSGTCTAVRAIGSGDGRDLALTSDGLWAYMVNQHASASDPAPSIVIFQRQPATGALTQLPGAAGCISANGSSQSGPSTCQPLPTLAAPNAVSISADNRFVYVSDRGPSPRIHVLARNPLTGSVSEVQCVAEAPAPAGCSTGRMLGDSRSLLLSPDGLHAYSADAGSDGISLLDRNPSTGVLTQPAGTSGCWSDTGLDNSRFATCSFARELGGADAESISPDGRTLYVAARDDDGIAIFHVNRVGTLQQLPSGEGCISLSGKDDLGNGSCATASAIQSPDGTAISPDGSTLYVSEFAGGTEGGIAAFALDRVTGVATQLPGAAGCVTADGSSSGLTGACATGPGLAGGSDPAVSPDGIAVYLAAEGSRAVDAFARTTRPVCFPATASTAFEHRVTISLPCGDADHDTIVDVIVSKPAHGRLGAVNQSNRTVTYFPDAGYTGADNFTFAATDGTNRSARARATVSVKLPPRPIIGRLAQTHKIWREGNRLPALAAAAGPAVGTAFSFTLNVGAQVTFTFAQRLRGRKLGRGVLSLHGRAGNDRVSFQGRLSATARLPLGAYAVTIVATGPDGRSRPHRLRFTIAR